ncbi:MAG: Mrp/NBP35 family ATP-binding protein [Chloroflexota bacterium]|nr:Mrp/NBP35 family ATP-binding protein [Chloroflexota bacterium]
MVTEEQVRDSLKEVLVPGVGRDLVALNMVRGVGIADQAVNVTLASTALSEMAQDVVRAKTQVAVKKLPGIKEAQIDFVSPKSTELNQIGNVIAVMSGKGGVGKSLVSSLIAVALRRRGHEIGILDADIIGPTIPRMFGISGRPAGSDTGILPVVSKTGIEVMSMGLLLPTEDAAVIWRGPLLSKAISQFWEDVVWGKLDYLVVDLPPGTADASLTVLQVIPVSGIVIVFTPQDLTTMIVRKAVNMARKMNTPILGVIENMSYLYVAEIDKRMELFGRSKGEMMAAASGAPLLGQLPIDPELARLCDDGDIESYQSESFTAFARTLDSTLAAAPAGKREPGPKPD